MKSYTDLIKILNYVLLFALLVALIFSTIITGICIYNKQVNNFNTWQFPMLLALFGDQILFLFFK